MTWNELKDRVVIVCVVLSSMEITQNISGYLPLPSVDNSSVEEEFYTSTAG